MRAIWKGFISFGLVNIPIALFPATRNEELKFHILRGSDLSPINFKRVAAADGKTVEWKDIVKGYEYEKGKFVVLKDEDFKRVDIEATETVRIVSFVDLEEVSPTFFHRPYFMEVQKGGDAAYILLRDALVATGKIGIARVVIKTREYLAAVKPQQKGLMLELMHFADEMVDTGAYKIPGAIEPVKKEMDMAKSLIASISEKWNPKEYTDEYSAALEKVIEEKIAKGGENLPVSKKSTRPANVIDLVSILQKSLEQTETRSKTKAKAQDQKAAKSSTAAKKNGKAS